MLTGKQQRILSQCASCSNTLYKKYVMLSVSTRYETCSDISHRIEKFVGKDTPLPNSGTVNDHLEFLVDDNFVSMRREFLPSFEKGKLSYIDIYKSSEIGERVGKKLAADSLLLSENLGIDLKRIYGTAAGETARGRAKIRATTARHAILGYLYKNPGPLKSLDIKNYMAGLLEGKEASRAKNRRTYDRYSCLVFHALARLEETGIIDVKRGYIPPKFAINSKWKGNVPVYIDHRGYRQPIVTKNILSVLKKGSSDLRKIAKEIGRDPHNISMALYYLMNKGYLTRTGHPYAEEGCIRMQIQLTDFGKPAAEYSHRMLRMIEDTERTEDLNPEKYGFNAFGKLLHGKILPWYNRSAISSMYR